MVQSSHTLFRRIRCIKSSLEKAEQSFMDNKDIRGELDLMLAEAELKNLRRKKDCPWNWNRQLLAGCAAILLILAGAGGWLCAKDHYRTKVYQVSPVPVAAAKVTEPVRQNVINTAAEKQSLSAEINAETVKHDIPVQKQETVADRVTISKADMYKLVQSARVELSNSN